MSWHQIQSLLQLNSTPRQFSFVNNALQRDQLPVGFIAQVVEHCTLSAEVMGSNAIQA